MAGADKFIGVTFYAAKPRTKFRIPGDYKFLPTGAKKLYTFKPGELIGVVYSWLQKDGKLYWMFYDSQNKPYYVEHSDDAIQRTPQVKSIIKVEDAKRKAAAEADILKAQEVIKESKGDFAYYFEKYGKVVLGVVVGTILIKTILEKKL